MQVRALAGTAEGIRGLKEGTPRAGGGLKRQPYEHLGRTSRAADHEDGILVNGISCVLVDGILVKEIKEASDSAQSQACPGIPICMSRNAKVVGDEPAVRRALFAISSRFHENVTGERPQGGGYMTQGPGVALMLSSGSMLYPSNLDLFTGHLQWEFL
ncbi:hypothetical protein L7F22_020494 [Adiantum nelumboides]|nr:hypothetical protein [Adiantum nelumboides]